MSNRTQTIIVQYHHSMLTDRVRTEGYRQAILETVKPGDVVLDIGTGTGIMAFFACQAGARKVYAVETGPVVEIARQIRRRNGLQECITLLHDMSFNIELPEQVDVILTETLGNFGLEEGIASIVYDAQARMLKAEGKVIPQSVELIVAPVQNPQLHEQLSSWTDDLYGIDYSPMRALAANTLRTYAVERRSARLGV